MIHCFLLGIITAPVTTPPPHIHHHSPPRTHTHTHTQQKHIKSIQPTQNTGCLVEFFAFTCTHAHKGVCKEDRQHARACMQERGIHITTKMFSLTHAHARASAPSISRVRSRTRALSLSFLSFFSRFLARLHFLSCSLARTLSPFLSPTHKYTHTHTHTPLSSSDCRERPMCET